jgi:hypothetical protein
VPTEARKRGLGEDPPGSPMTHYQVPRTYIRLIDETTEARRLIRGPSETSLGGVCPRNQGSWEGPSETSPGGTKAMHVLEIYM